jgi:rSAM/selenodomain-associated transferase 2
VAARLKLSVIIPVGPGDQAWRDLLGDLAALRGDAEIILVATPGAIPRDFRMQDYQLEVPTSWLAAPAGRARQQNAGAAAAGGEVLWFLHADSRVPAGTLAAARHFDRDAAIGYFDLAFGNDGPRLVRLNALGARIRSRWLQLPFGDQGFILTHRLFESLGGFDQSLPVGEDHALVWTARRAGVELLPLRAPLQTSARRFAERGWLRTTLRNACLTLSQAQRFARTRRKATDPDQ